MSELAIRAESLSKEFRLGRPKEKYKTLRDALAMSALNPWHKNKKTTNSGTFHALRDVSFDIERGEVVGVVGRNGAGKTTLLKLLSRITEPTSGSAIIHGRIGSLLEVGTGFHNELSGRENIFLNGTILGMKKAEIARKFDEIVDFAEVEKFIDTPVKHYSSGMYMRLAFSVAAHLEPEILLIDEVLAVGDSDFQKKCLGKMEDIGHQGRTVLFVSHNLAAVRSLCNKGILLHQGKLVETGNIGGVIETYYKSISQDAEKANTGMTTYPQFGPVTANGSVKPTLQQSDMLELATTLNITHEVGGFTLSCFLEDMHGERIFHLRQVSSQLYEGELTPRLYHITLSTPALWLNPGLYSLYFKVFYWGEFASSYHLSDRLLIDVTGISSKTSAVLHPHSTWSFSQSDNSAQHQNASNALESILT